MIPLGGMECQARACRLSAPVIVKKLVIRERRDGPEKNPEKELLKRKAHSEDIHHTDKLALGGKFPLAKRERRYFIDEREKEKIHACLEDSPHKRGHAKDQENDGGGDHKDAELEVKVINREERMICREHCEED